MHIQFILYINNNNALCVIICSVEQQCTVGYAFCFNGAHIYTSKYNICNTLMIILV